MSLNGVLSSGLSAILANSTALRVTSDNIANVNTPGYHRRVIDMQTQAPGGQLGGVEIADVRRVLDQFLMREMLASGSASAQYDAQENILGRLDSALGQPGDKNSVLGQMNTLYASLGQLSTDPSSMAQRQGVLDQIANLAQSVSGLASTISSLRQNADADVGQTVGQINELVRKIYEINPQIQRATISGDTASGLLDQRDQMVQQLSGLIGIKTTMQPDGRMFISTTDGMQLVGDLRAQLSYITGSQTSFNPITVQTLSAEGQPLGAEQTFDFHATSGALRGLLDARDNDLVQVGEELGALSQSLALGFNAVHNASAAVPPPAEMDGRNTGLLATDGLNFTGATTIGIADANGVLQHKIAVDFTAGTLSVDGGGAVSIGSTVGSFTAALNSALGGNGTASFTDGVLSLSATGGNGFVIADDATNPSARGGVRFSQFFGLNDVFQAAGNSIVTTGLSASDAHGFAPGGQISLLLKGPLGQRANEVTVNVTGSTIGDMVAALNSSFAGKATFSLDASGQLTMTPAPQFAGYDLEVTADTTARGTTGTSISQLFGLGTGQAMAQATNFSVRDDLKGSPARFALAQTSLTAASALGDTIAASGDNRGALALQSLGDARLTFAAAGGMQARTASLSEYAASFFQDVGTRSATANDRKTSQDARYQEAQTRSGAVDGVNMDEELMRMMTLQQAYNAGARLIKTAQDLFDQLLQVV